MNSTGTCEHGNGPVSLVEFRQFLKQLSEFNRQDLHSMVLECLHLLYHKTTPFDISTQQLLNINK